MDLALFDFDLPKERIALRPVAPRDQAKLLVVTPDQKILLSDAHVYNLADYLSDKDVLVFNDTKVIPSRLFGKRGEAKVEATLHKQISPDTWDAFVRPAKKYRIGDEINYGGLKAIVLDKRDGGEVTLKFDVDQAEALEAIKQHGAMPLPPYIAGQRPADERDLEDYQTIYSKEEGAVAAPTAGLHFTPDLMDKLDEKGVQRAFVTLHVGAGTFLPVKVDNTDDHKMHFERGSISQQTADHLNRVRANGGKIVSVGTTSLRLLESAADDAGVIHPFEDETDIFIRPGYKFKAIDALMTNFHLPKSTLFMLVSAFSGLDEMRKAYDHAINHNYRFYSYGDSSLLFPKTIAE